MNPQRVLVLDDASQLQGHATFYVTEKIGEKRAFTPEGFLLCMDVPIARTGEMLYGPGETSVKVGDQGYLIVERSEADVFRPEFMASFEGKPVVNDHPRDRNGVHPGNWKKLAVGSVINPRRGEGEHANFIVADLLITDADAIRDVMEGKREVSAGYEAEYQELKPGRARQYDMIANHVALVAAGRCGSRCAIGDELTTLGDEMRHRTNDNATTDTRSTLRRWWDGVAQQVVDAMTRKDDVALNAALATAPLAADEKAVHVHTGGRDEEAHAAIAALQSRFAALDALLPKLTKLVGDGDGDGDKDDETEEEKEKRKKKEAEDARMAEDLAAEAPAAMADKARLAKDSEFLKDSFQEAASGAEILIPGITIGTYDRSAAPKVTLDAICALRRNALDLAYSTNDGKALIGQLLGSGQTLQLSKMSCADARVLFRSAVATKKATVNAGTTVRRAAPAADAKQPIRSIADLNRRNAERFGPKKQ